MAKKKSKEQLQRQQRKKIQSKALWIVIPVVVILFIVVAFINLQQPIEYTELVSEQKVLGTEGAPILIEEFSDLQCPACSAAHPVVEQLLEEYGDVIEFRYKHFPLRAIHPYAYDAALAAECANEYDQFWPFVSTIFATQSQLNLAHMYEVAGLLGIPSENFEACVKSKTKESIVGQNIAEGERRNVRGTPTFFLDGELVESPTFARLSSLIEEKLEDAQQSTDDADES